MDPANVVNRLSAAFDALKTKLEETVFNYRDVLTYDPNNNRIDVSPQLQNQVDRYRRALGELRMEMPSLEGMLVAGLGGNVFVWDADAGPPDLVLPPDQLKRTVDRMKNAKMFVTRQGGEVNVELAPDFEKTVQDASKLFNELGRASRDYWEAVQRVVDEFNKSSGGRFKLKINDDGEIDIDEGVYRQGFDKVVNLNREYDAMLQELIRKYGAVVSEDGRRILVDPSKLDAFRADLSALNAWYSNEFDKILKEHGLTVKDGKIVVDASIYSDVFSKLGEIGQEHNKRLQDIRSKFGHLLVVTTDEKGRTVYTLKPSAISDVALYNTFVNIVDAHGAAVRQTIQNIVNKYGDVLSYDPATGKIAPSKELADMLSRYDRAMQEVNKLTSFMSAVAGMLHTTSQQMPVFTVKFQTYDKATNQWVEVGGETPIYVKDENMRREILDWMRRNEGRVKVAAFYDADKPVVYVFNDRDEGYIINPVTGGARRAKGVSGMVADTANAMWYKSLTDEEKRSLEQYYRLQWEKEQTKQMLQNMPPVARELYGTLIAAGQYAPISLSLDIVARAVLGQEDPLAGAKKIQTQAEAVKEVSPVAYYAGTGVGLAGLAGLGAEAILARGAAKLAAQGGKAAADDVAKFTAVKKPKLPVPGPIQHVQQTVKTPTLLQTAAAGLKDAAVPMAVSGAAFGGLEGVKSHLEVGKVDISRVLEGAAFGSLLGAFPLTKTQALAALGIGAGATAGVSLVRGYDLATSLAVGEAAGLTAVVGGGLKRTAEVSGAARTPGARAPEVKITDFATVMKPEGRPAPRVDLSGVDFAKRLSSAVGNVVADVVSGRVTVEEANLRLGAIRDAVSDKALFDKILQSFKLTREPPRASVLDFATAAKKAAEVVSAADSGKVPGYRAFVELADLRVSVVDKARFDRLFGAKLREYGEQYVNWLLNSGLDKPSIVLQLVKHEGVLGRRFIERYVPDYGRVLAEVETKLSQLRPVSPRERPRVKLTSEDVFARVKSLFDDVVEGRVDWFKASEELYKMWRDAPPEVRVEIEVVLNQLNRMYGEKYGVTLEPWRPSLLEKGLRMAELFAADVRSAVGDASRSIRQRLERGQTARLYEEAIEAVNKFRRGEISLEEAKRRLLEIAKKAERIDKELSDAFKKKAEELGRERVKEEPPRAEKRLEVRLPDERDVEWIRLAEEESRRMERQRFEKEEGGRGQRLLLLEKEKPIGEKVYVELIRHSRRPHTTSLKRPTTEAAVREVLTPETRIGLVQALRARAKTVPETALMPEIRQLLEWAQETGLKPTEISKLLKTPHGVQLLLRREPSRKKRRPIIPLKPPVLQTETPPQYDKPWADTPKLFGDIPMYSSPLLTSTTTPTTANVPSPSTYPPVTVPRISEVPTVGVPPAPINEKSPTPRQTRLPFGWWRFLPPWKVADDRADGGAYKVQEGKRQILALA